MFSSWRLAGQNASREARASVKSTWSMPAHIKKPSWDACRSARKRSTQAPAEPAAFLAFSSSQTRDLVSAFACRSSSAYSALHFTTSSSLAARQAAFFSVSISSSASSLSSRVYVDIWLCASDNSRSQRSRSDCKPAAFCPRCARSFAATARKRAMSAFMEVTSASALVRLWDSLANAAVNSAQVMFSSWAAAAACASSGACSCSAFSRTEFSASSTSC
mmetsp:Transcript_111772/g.197993  ORF Transcript_111772/g.197993 Transcript_111772/m.197993 type:complete len:219 (+) Transcript_111772:868-1524(+)